jgi:hypothetical protein
MMSILGAAFQIGFGAGGGSGSSGGGFDAGTQMYYDQQWQKYDRRFQNPRR